MAAKPINPYQQQVLAHWDLLNQLARRRFPERGSRELSNLAFEGRDFVLDKLEEDDWSRVRQYRGQSTFEAYLATIARRLLEDFARQKLGRPRVPAWIKRLGPLWERAYQKLCWERLPAPTVIEEMRAAFDPGRDPAALEEIESAIGGGIIRCGAPTLNKIEEPFANLPETFDVNEVADPADETPEDRIAAEQRVRLLEIVAKFLEPRCGDGRVPDLDGSPLADVLRKLRDALSLTTAEERLLLRLVYLEGMTVTDAGSRLGLNASQTHGRLRRLLERIRSAWQAAGFGRLPDW